MKRIAALFLVASFCMTYPVTASAMETAGDFKTTDTTITTEVSNLSDGSNAAEAICFTIEHLGYPYSMERRDSGSAFDCSSLMYYAYQDAGVDISNGGSTTAAEIARGLSASGKTVAPDNIQPGDLIFYSYKKMDVSGIFLMLPCISETGNKLKRHIPSGR